MTQAERVRDALEHDIVRGVLLPGMRLEDDEIARRFGVSRTPVREAILQLVETGLVTKQPRQGAVVAYLDVTQMIQMFELTSELSGLCGKFATRRMSAADKKRMRDINANLEKAVKADSVEDYTLHNRRFHDWIIRQSRNDFLIEAINRMSRRLMAYFNYHLTYPGQIERDFHDHCTLISAIETSDAELAQQLLRRHAMIQGDIFAEFVSMSHRTGHETGIPEFANL